MAPGRRRDLITTNSALGGLLLCACLVIVLIHSHDDVARGLPHVQMMLSRVSDAMKVGSEVKISRGLMMGRLSLPLRARHMPSRA